MNEVDKSCSLSLSLLAVCTLGAQMEIFRTEALRSTVAIADIWLLLTMTVCGLAFGSISSVYLHQKVLGRLVLFPTLVVSAIVCHWAPKALSSVSPSNPPPPSFFFAFGSSVALLEASCQCEVFRIYSLERDNLSQWLRMNLAAMSVGSTAVAFAEFIYYEEYIEDIILKGEFYTVGTVMVVLSAFVLASVIAKIRKRKSWEDQFLVSSEHSPVPSELSGGSLNYGTITTASKDEYKDQMLDYDEIVDIESEERMEEHEPIHHASLPPVPEEEKEISDDHPTPPADATNAANAADLHSDYSSVTDASATTFKLHYYVDIYVCVMLFLLTMSLSLWSVVVGGGPFVKSNGWFFRLYTLCIPFSVTIGQVIGTILSTNSNEAAVPPNKIIAHVLTTVFIGGCMVPALMISNRTNWEYMTWAITIVFGVCQGACVMFCVEWLCQASDVDSITLALATFSLETGRSLVLLSVCRAWLEPTSAIIISSLFMVCIAPLMISSRNWSYREEINPFASTMQYVEL